MTTVLRWLGCAGRFELASAKAPPPSRSRTLVEFIPLEIGEDALAYGHPSDLVVHRLGYWRPRQYVNPGCMFRSVIPNFLMRLSSLAYCIRNGLFLQRSLRCVVFKVVCGYN
jgi:hypothetical protein